MHDRHSNRGRITVSPLETSYWSRPSLMGAGARPPKGWTALAELERGDGDRGLLVRNHTTGAYGLWTGRALQSVPDRKALAALNEAGIDIDAEPTGESDELPAMLKDWRGRANINQDRAAEMLGVSLKTYQGWEQGRSMPYPRLLALAILAFE